MFILHVSLAIRSYVTGSISSASVDHSHPSVHVFADADTDSALLGSRGQQAASPGGSLSPDLLSTFKEIDQVILNDPDTVSASTLSLVIPPAVTVQTTHRDISVDLTRGGTEKKKLEVERELSLNLKSPLTPRRVRSTAG